MKTRDIFVVVIFGLVMRAFLEITITNVFGGDPYYIDLFCAGGMYLLMGIILWWIIRKDPISIEEVIGYPINKITSLKMIVLAILLLAFTMGESAVEVMIMALVNLNFAYNYWPFHSDRHIVHPIWSSQVILYLIVHVLIAPVIEDFNNKPL